MYFTHDFRSFSKNDYMMYAGAEKLSNGDYPWIYNVETKDNVGVDIIISGDDNEEGTILSIETENLGSYMLSFQGCNRIVAAVADAMIEDFNNYEVTSEAIEAIVSDFGMNRIL